VSSTLAAQFETPFKWSWKDDKKQLTVTAEIPPGHYLYQAQTNVNVLDASGIELPPEAVPLAATHEDEFSGQVKIYPSGNAIWHFQLDGQAPFAIKIDFLGCKDKTATSPALCFAPGSKKFIVGSNIPATAATTTTTTTTQVSSGMPSGLSALLGAFKTERNAAGYLNVDEFMNFLEGKNPDNNLFANKSMLVIILLIILGGLGLNLTPCVLPMIPVNLAIIGAGGDNDSKRQGFFRGGAYGLGIALAYGILGVIAVLTGAKFGALNSSALFNFIIAVIFFVLALAMFDVFMIDFSKYSAKLGRKDSNGSKVITAFVMGVVAALLAGACVAPVVISVLLLSAKIYSSGNPAGLFLPLLLGVGMALPWPFAGAGMAVIPKPGMWMVRVKYIFGVIIIAAGLWFAYTGFTLLPAASEKEQSAGQSTALETALVRAKAEHKPILIDFWASWCKNCTYMNHTTLKDQQVQDALEKFIVVKFQAEDMNAAEIKPILDYFKVPGLPAFVILRPIN